MANFLSITSGLKVDKSKLSDPVKQSFFCANAPIAEQVLAMAATVVPSAVADEILRVSSEILTLIDKEICKSA